MDHVPTVDEMREVVGGLDELDQKVLGGLVALWMAAPEHVRDREWTAQRFVHVATVAHGFDAEQGPATSADVERIRAYAEEHMERVVRIGLMLFVRVADDLRHRGREPRFEDAQAALRSYLA